MKEIIKITSVLYNAMKMNGGGGGSGTDNITGGAADSSAATAAAGAAASSFDLSTKLGELKQTRQLGSHITTKGAALYDLLGKEVELRERRTLVLSRQLEIAQASPLSKCLYYALRALKFKQVTFLVHILPSATVCDFTI